MKSLVNKNYDSFFDDLFATPLTKNMMSTDIVEENGSYLFTIDVPSVNKEDIKISLDNGYLTIEASYEKEETDKNYVRKERCSGTFARSYYVGENITEEDINAKLENGVLKLIVNKNDKLPEKKYISIE